MRPRVICRMVASLDGRQDAPALSDGDEADSAASFKALRLDHPDDLDRRAVGPRCRLEVTA
ncbi:MAG TPA: hypothetical protein VKS60_08555 [Stellaceae bacterium]|nr:hypothetical protein [Stellaceae bacterium]